MGLCNVALALLLLADTVHAAPTHFCVSDQLGFVTSLETSCPSGTHPLMAAGVNLFDVVWGAVDPAHTFNLSESQRCTVSLLCLCVNVRVVM